MRPGAGDWRDVLVEALSTAFLVADADSGVVLHASEAFSKVIGAPTAPIPGATLDDVLGDPDLFARLHDNVGGRVQLQTGAGGRASVDATVHEVEWGGSASLMLLVDDAVRHREIERALDELAEFPRTNPGPVLRLDSEGLVVLANEAAGRLFQQESLVGASWPSLCDGVTEIWETVIGSQEPIRLEADVGDRRMSFAHVFRPARQVVFVYGTDVTLLREQERQLAEQARFPDMNPGPVLRLDLAGTVLLSNVAARELLPEATVGSRWQDACPAADGVFWSTVLASDAPVAVEARIRGRDYQFTHRLDPGQYVFVYGADVTRQKAAERTARDSERLATLGTLAAGVAHELNNPAAAARRASAHLSDALQALESSGLGLASAGLSEQALTLVGSLESAARSRRVTAGALGSLEQADREDEVAEWLSAHAWPDLASEGARQWVALGLDVAELERLASEVGDALGLVVERVGALADLVGLIEQVQRSTTRVSEIALALKRYTYLGQAEVLDVDLSQSLDDTLLILGHKLGSGPRVVREYASDVPTIWGIGSELNQVWMNLLDNAIDAAGTTGNITVRTRLVQADAPRDARVEVEVEDNGPGMPVELQARVFEPFFTTKPPGSGTGLGLATAWSIVVDRHHGTLSVESVPGCTRFVASLPLTPPTSTRATEGTAP